MTEKKHLVQNAIWTANLEPATGNEPGKTRPVVLIQSDLLHRAGHTSTIVCAISSQQRQGVSMLRLKVDADDKNGLQKTSYIIGRSN